MGLIKIRAELTVDDDLLAHYEAQAAIAGLELDQYLSRHLAWTAAVLDLAFHSKRSTVFLLFLSKTPIKKPRTFPEEPNQSRARRSRAVAADTGGATGKARSFRQRLRAAALESRAPGPLRNPRCVGGCTRNVVLGE